jgi:hypothetical protein
MAIELRPFQDYDEHDVLNLFGWSGAVPVNKGTIVQIQGGWKNTDEIERLGSPGASYTNTVSERYGVKARITACDATSTPLGMMLYDVKETDENGEKLIFNPRKAMEMEVALSGQAVPVLTRGVVLYSGTVLATETPVASTALYSDANGELTTGNGGGGSVGRALGPKDDNSHVLVRLAL